MGQRSEILGLWLALGVVFLSPFALGVVHPIPIAIFGVLSITAWLLFRPTRIPWLILPMLMAFVFCVLMTVPIPESWFLALHPNHPVNQAPFFASLDMPETAARALQLLTALCIFAVISEGSQKNKNQRLFFQFVLFAACALFTVAALHRILDIPIWGVFSADGTPFFAPIANSNHLGRVFGTFSLLCLAGASFGHWRKTFFLASVLCGAGVFLSLSRGAILFFLVFFVLSALSQKSLRPAVVVLVLASGLALFLAYEFLAPEIANLAQLDKFGSYPRAFAIMSANPLGIGPGATGVEFFRTVQPQVNADVYASGQHSVQYIENLFLQTVVDYGPIGAALLFTAIALAVISIWRNKSRLVVAVLPTLAFIVLSDSLDFSFETGSTLFMASALIALIASENRLRERVLFRLSPSASLIVGMLFVIPATLYANTIIRYGRYSLDQNLGSIDSALVGVEKHPFDSYYQSVAAQHYFERGDFDKASRFAKSALVLRPTNAMAHLIIAKITKDARHYRLAWMSNPDLAKHIVHDMPTKEVLPTMTSENLIWLCEALQTNECLFDLLQMPKHEFLTLKRATELAISLKNPVAFSVAQKVVANEPSGENYKLLARAAEAKFGANRALEMAQGWLREARDPCMLLEWSYLSSLNQGSREIGQHNLAALKECIGKTISPTDYDAAQAQWHEANNDFAQALRIVNGLTLVKTNDISLLIWQASLALKTGQASAAKHSIERLEALAPTNEAIASLRERLAYLCTSC